MFEGAAALFMVLGLAALGRLMAAAFAVFGRFRLLPPELAARFGRFDEPLLDALGRFVVAKSPGIRPVRRRHVVARVRAVWRAVGADIGSIRRIRVGHRRAGLLVRVVGPSPLIRRLTFPGGLAGRLIARAPKLDDCSR